METLRDIGKFVIVIVLAILFGSLISACASNSLERGYDNLLFQEENRNVAYKSITIKDYKGEDYCG